MANGGTPDLTDVLTGYQVDIEKFMGTEFWTNRYIVRADSLQLATDLGQQIVGIERAVHDARVSFTKLSVRTRIQGDGRYTTTTLNLTGNVSNPGVELAPLFVVARVDFNAEEGRPSRKYLRGVINEVNLQGMRIASDAVAFINQNYASPLASLADFVDVDMQELVSGSCSQNTGMRQLRRGSKKKSTQSSTGTAP